MEMLRKEFQKKILKGVMFPAFHEWIVSDSVVKVKKGGKIVTVIPDVWETLRLKKPVLRIYKDEEEAELAVLFLEAELWMTSPEDMDRMITYSVQVKNLYEESEEFLYDLDTCMEEFKTIEKKEYKIIPIPKKITTEELKNYLF